MDGQPVPGCALTPCVAIFPVGDHQLAIDTPDGIVLVVGCSHSTIEKVVEAAKSATGKPIHLVLGGTHLLPANDGQISAIAVERTPDTQPLFVILGVVAAINGAIGALEVIGIRSVTYLASTRVVAGVVVVIGEA